MPKVSKDSAAHVEQHGPVEDRHEDIDGYTVNFVSFGVDIDGTALLKGLPGDACPCPHWGYVLKGRLTYRFADHEEVFEAGDAFYLPPGHIPLADAGSELVQFSPRGAPRSRRRDDQEHAGDDAEQLSRRTTSRLKARVPTRTPLRAAVRVASRTGSPWLASKRRSSSRCARCDCRRSSARSLAAWRSPCSTARGRAASAPRPPGR